MRLVIWNIRHGSSKVKLPAIVQALLETKGNIIVVTEFQTKSADLIQNQLKEASIIISSLPIHKKRRMAFSLLTTSRLPYYPNNIIPIIHTAG